MWVSAYTPESSWQVGVGIDVCSLVLIGSLDGTANNYSSELRWVP